MSIVLTNDDGIDAPGLKALESIVGDRALTIAPAGPLSGCSHRVTTFDGPIRVEHRSERAYAVHGTPADCTRIALSTIAPDTECVISGINLGGNLGMDVYLSGTVAAAREAAFHGVLGIAVSHYVRRREPLDWERAAEWTARVLEDILSREHVPGTYWNVNLPHLDAGAEDPQVALCHVCSRALPVSYRVEGEDYHYEGVYSDRARDPGADVDQCFSGNIAVSLLKI